MTIHPIREAPSPPLRDALMRFERQFVYPLGPGRTFRIEHGCDYARFYLAIGEAQCFVYEEDGQVLGVISVAVRPVLRPDGEAMPVAYIGDVKVAPGPRRGAVLLRMVREAEPWCRARAVAAFGVVMDGTPVVPSAYTGRLGIPAFVELGKTIVFRFLCAASASMADAFQSDESGARTCYASLVQGRFACLPGVPAERSEIPPTWLVHPQGACGCLEDTRRAKRLIADDGQEMRSAHLSAFAYRDVRVGAEFLRVAIGRAAALGFPALFVAVPAAEAEALRGELQELEAVRAPATVFGFQFETGPLWNVNTSEI
ncbi:MAG: GNAT family N-acetyltransferase [Gemmataceae bacterium]|nr:GNAT family N-acetyltransferase [Gemmataceae bacterium]